MTSEYILISLRKIIRALNIESKRIQKEFGVSIPQLLTLRQLKKSPDYQLTITGLSQSLSLNPSTITGIISRLSNHNLVARLPKQGDKRVSTITLTATGSELLAQTPKLFHEKLDEQLSQLSDHQLETIRAGLTLLTSMLEIGGIEASPLLTVREDLATDEISEP